MSGSEQRASLPLSNDSLSLTLPDRRLLAYAQYGSPEGLPVFYLHGALSSRLEASVLDDAARAENVRLIGVDRPGIGGSSPDRNRTHASIARDLAALADALQLKRFAILGLSLGGAYALSAGETLGDRVTAIAVCSGMAPPGRADLARPRLARWLLALSRHNGTLLFLLAALMAYLIRKHGARMLVEGSKHPYDRRPLEIAGVAERIATGWIEGTKNGAATVVADVQTVLRPWDVELRPLSCPVHFWHGLQDTTVPPESARVNAQLVHSPHVHLVEDFGHNLVVELGRDVLRTLTTDTRDTRATNQAPLEQRA